MNLPSGFLNSGKGLISGASSVKESCSLTQKPLLLFEPITFVQCFIVLFFRRESEHLLIANSLCATPELRSFQHLLTGVL